MLCPLGGTAGEEDMLFWMGITYLWVGRGQGQDAARRRSAADEGPEAAQLRGGC